MIQTIELKSLAKHHANCFLGEREVLKSELFRALENEWGILLQNNPDLVLGDYKVLKISDSRVINDAQQKKSTDGRKKIFVIAADFITRDAQNSLLKMFEDPTPNTTFFLILPPQVNLLPTLKSRLNIIKFSEETDSAKALKFYKSSVGTRLKFVQNLLSDLKEEKISKIDILKFLKNLEQIMSQEKNKKYEAILDIEQAVSYLNDESPSIKTILEHLALSI